MVFTPLITVPAEVAGTALWFAFRGGAMLIAQGAGAAALPTCKSLRGHGITTADGHYLGTLDEQHCFTCELAADVPLPAGFELKSLRSLLFIFDDTLTGIAGRAFQIKEWDRTHRYCGSCGAPTAALVKERARQCTPCSLLFYPRISPVVMVLVTRGRDLLLTRKAGYVAGRYTVIAGFVEAGETLEEAVARETLEEANVAVTNIRYFGCQPWPFPHALVMAFHAEYAAGDAQADGVELEEARWFSCDRLPDLPEPVHVSRKLIDAAVTNLKG